MNTNLKNPAMRRYLKRFFPTMAACAVILIAAKWAFTRFHPPGLVAFGLATLPAIPIIGIIVVVGMYLAEEKDEFQRNVPIQTLLWALGATLAATTIWGFLEVFGQVPHLESYLVFPLFWAFVGVIAPFVKLGYR